MIRFRTFSVMIHLVAWLLFMSFPLLFMSQGTGEAYHLNLSKISGSYLQFCLLYILIFYLNTWFLFPKLYIRKKYLLYGLSIFALLIVVLTLKPFDQLLQNDQRPGRSMPIPSEKSIEHRPPPPGRHRPDFPPPHLEKKPFQFDIISLFILMMVLGLGTALRSIKEWQLTEKRAILAEADRANAELSFLKAQINPHFLYNTLNNIYTLTVTGSTNAAECIMKLSNMMRYITDEAEADYVDLQDELNCITNFIDLQKLRLGKKVTLIYTLEGDTQHHKISPLILMTFIENIFKYGLSNHYEALIKISIRTEGNKILFYSQNQIFENNQRQERSGVGIKNTRQRLDHLYGGNYTLTINDRNGLFTVNLILES